jgi:hypothetical protein
MVGPVVKRFGEKHTLIIGLVFAASSWGGSALTHSLPLFIADARARRDRHRLLQSVARVARQRRRRAARAGRVQGAAGALEASAARSARLGQRPAAVRGEGAAYGSAAVVLLATAALTTRYQGSAGSHAKVRPTITS